MSRLVVMNQIKRDEERRIACKELGITLIEIPHWWDETERKCKKIFCSYFFLVSLLATILQKRPDLRACIHSDLLGSSQGKLTCRNFIRRLRHFRTDEI